jgi:chromosomal replication initiator protein
LRQTNDLAAALGPAIASRIGEPRYRLWFHGHTAFAWDGRQLTVGVPNRFFQEWLQSTFTAHVTEAANELLGGPLTVRFVIDPALFQKARQLTAAPEPAPAAGRPPAGPTEAPTRPPRRLEEFIVGRCNQLAYAAATALLTHAEELPNPVTFYGPPGVGKTHLLEGLCQELARTPGEEPVLVTAEEFTNRFLPALRANQVAAFRKSFREATALLVDDVQFVARKKATQEELLHTIDAQVRRGRPVVVTAAAHPRQLAGLLPELADRLLGGGVWSLALPDAATRRDILELKALRHGCRLDDEVLAYLAENLRGNFRELEGAFHAVRHYAAVHRKPLTLEVARAATADLLPPEPGGLEFKDVEEALCRVLGIEAKRLHAPDRTRAVSHPRMVAMYLLRRHTKAPYRDIAQYYGSRNHSTAIMAEARVASWLTAETPLVLAGRRWDLKALVDAVAAQLR